MANIEEINHTAAFIRTHFYTKTLPHLSEEQQADYNTLRTRLFDEIEPHNALEHEIFEQLVHASWQLDRARALEDGALFKLTSEPDHPQFRRDFHAFARIRRALDRTIAAAFKELRRLTATRILAVAIDCNTIFTTDTNAKVPPLLDLRETLPANEIRSQRSVLSMSLARLRNPLATYTPPEEVLDRIRREPSAA